MNGRLRLALSVIASVSCAAACSGGGKAAVSVRVATDLRTEIRDARLVRSVLIDGGNLRLDPITTAPQLTEARAILLFRAGGNWQVSNVTVVYASATLRTPVRRDPTLDIQPQVEPQFVHRPAWVIVWEPGPSFGCLSAGDSKAPATQSIVLIAADGTGEGVAYQTAGSQCGKTVGPQVSVADYFISLPWTVAFHSGIRLVIRHAAPPPCSDLEGGQELFSATSKQITVMAYVLMARPPCTTPRITSTDTESLSPQQVLSHGPTGLSQLYKTGRGSTLTYFDGATRTVR